MILISFLKGENQRLPRFKLHSKAVSIVQPIMTIDRDLVKKVESTLLNLEKKEPQKQEFFKVPRMGSGMKEMSLGVIAPSENAGGAPLGSNGNNSDLFNESNNGNPIENIKKGNGLKGGGSTNKIKILQN